MGGASPAAAACGQAEVGPCPPPLCPLFMQHFHECLATSTTAELISVLPGKGRFDDTWEVQLHGIEFLWRAHWCVPVTITRL